MKWLTQSPFRAGVGLAAIVAAVIVLSPFDGVAAAPEEAARDARAAQARAPAGLHVLGSVRSIGHLFPGQR